MEMDDLKSLIELMNANGLSELEIEEDGAKIRLVKETSRKTEVVAVAAHMPQVVAQGHPAPAQQAEAPGETDIHEITAPMVGTFYRAPSPDIDPFVDEGMKVTEDATVCIIEAMKVMNEIHAEVTGTIVEILVDNGQPVEYGQPLFKVKLED